MLQVLSLFFLVIVVSFFLFIRHKSHTTSHQGFKIEETVPGVHRLLTFMLILLG